ncbi:MAG: type II secretion system F family protein, partial [Candidatus Gastranaerophilales bacterium]|nr:type II secretion system F family protein [Candidatus Gastranaerophilales bacterium]
MSRFFYRVRNASGKILQDYISASSVADAAIKLEKKGCIVLEIKEDKKDVNNFNFSNHAKLCILTLSEKKEFFNSFYFLYKSGLSIFEIFKSICNSSKNQAIIGLCRQVIKGVEKGKSLKESMKSCSNALGIAYTTLISTGEEAGKLEENLLSILKNVTRQEEIKSNLISSLTYPVSIFFLAIAVGLIFKFFVFEIFSQRTQGNTYVNIAGIASAAIIKILIIFAIIFTVIFFVYKNKNLRNSIIKFILNIGIFEKLLKNYNLLNFFSIRAMAYDSGIPVSESIMLANSVINIPDI